MNALKFKFKQKLYKRKNLDKFPLITENIYLLQIVNCKL